MIVPEMPARFLARLGTGRTRDNSPGLQSGGQEIGRLRVSPGGTTEIPGMAGLPAVPPGLKKPDRIRLFLPPLKRWAIIRSSPGQENAAFLPNPARSFSRIAAAESASEGLRWRFRLVQPNSARSFREEPLPSPLPLPLF